MVPDFTGTTWGDLLIYVESLKYEIAIQSADREAIRTFYEKLPTP